MLSKNRLTRVSAQLRACSRAQRESECRPKASKLPSSHFLGHIEDELPVGVRRLTQQSTESAQIARVLAAAAPNDIVGRFSLKEVRQLRRFLTVVEELIEWAFKRARQLLERFDCRDRVTVFDARNVAAKK